MITIRFRSAVWFITGALLTVAVLGVFANPWRADAAPGDSDTTFVPLPAPCRLMDTRPAPDRVGTDAAFGVDDTRTLQAVGTNGNCTIPADAVGLSLNVTATNATTLTFLTFWPEGVRPTTSNLNPSAGAPPTPNAVTVALSAAGAFNIYNRFGSVNVIVDVNGYSTKTSLQELTARINNLEASQPFTVASPLIDLVFAQPTPTLIRQVTVAAPADGHVAVIASGYMSEGTDGNLVECGLVNGVTDPPPGVEVLWQKPTAGAYAMLSASRVFTIERGSRINYSLVCLSIGGGTSGIWSPQVTAIFTPAR